MCPERPKAAREGPSSCAPPSLNNVAELYRAQGRYPEANLLYKRALAIREKALGPEYPAVATVPNFFSA